MNCPVCTDSRMREVEKNGVLIDLCPSCKGVWLDRGELDKLMTEVREVRDEYNEWYYDEKPKNYPPQSQKNYPPQQSQSYDNRDRPYGSSSSGSHQGPYNNHGNYKHKKKRSVMDVFGDLFD